MDVGINGCGMWEVGGGRTRFVRIITVRRSEAVASAAMYSFYTEGPSSRKRVAARLPVCPSARMSKTALPDPVFIAFQSAIAGKYSIDRELGRGGMGIVYLAHEVHLDRLVAIKLLPPERGRQPEVRDRFLREARLAAKLSHPNIIPIHAVEESGGFVYYVMAFVDGDMLSSRVRARGPMPASEGARVLREVAWTLAHAHGQGLVHRDVKPENILKIGRASCRER